MSEENKLNPSTTELNSENSENKEIIAEEGGQNDNSELISKGVADLKSLLPKVSNTITQIAIIESISNLQKNPNDKNLKKKIAIIKKTFKSEIDIQNA